MLVSRRLLPAVTVLIPLCFWQVEDLGVYVGAAECLSALSDSEIDRIARVAEVKYCDHELRFLQVSLLFSLLSSANGTVPADCHRVLCGLERNTLVGGAQNVHSSDAKSQSHVLSTVMAFMDGMMSFMS